MQTLSNAVQLSHILMKSALCQAKVIADATAGNGNDTLFLAQNAAEDALIYAFDIQKEALEKAELKIYEEKNICMDKSQIKFICDSHDKIDAYISGKIDLAVFNLGYLPGGSHSVTTKCATTMKALKKVLDKLSLNGYVALVVYPGHEEGMKEKQLIEQFASSLPKKYFTVGWYQMINHNINAPALCWIEKVGE